MNSNGKEKHPLFPFRSVFREFRIDSLNFDDLTFDEK